MPSNWAKYPQQFYQGSLNTLNGGTGESTLGGSISSVPSGVGATQGNQTRPGDRIVIGMEDALALSDTDTGTLYGGMYQFVQLVLGATLSAIKGHAAFVDTAETDSDFVVTTDEDAGETDNLWQGVFINAIAKGSFGYIQIAGKATLMFTTPLTGAVPVDGNAVFIAGDDAGRFDVFAGNAANPTFDQVQSMFNHYAGVAESAPAAATASIVDIPLRQVRF